MISYKPSGSKKRLPNFSRLGLSTLIVSALSVSTLTGSALAQKVPPHIASMAATLFDEVSATMTAADPDTSRGWATIRSHRALVDMGIERWRKGTPPGWAGRASLIDTLGIDPNLPNHAKAFDRFLHRIAKLGLQPALEELYDALGRSFPDGPRRQTLLKNVQLALQQGFEDLDRQHVTKLDTGAEVKMHWEPQSNRFSIEVHQPGDDNVAPYSTSLRGEITPSRNPDQEETSGTENTGAGTATEEPVDDQATDLHLVAAEVPVQSLDDQDLSQLKASVFGVWLDEGGVRWYITPASGDVEEESDNPRVPNPRAQMLDRIAEIESQLAGSSASKVFVWVNLETGEREEQKKFRRKKDPWDYQGEHETAGLDNKSELEAELAELKSNLSRVSQMGTAPDLPQETSDGRVQSIKVSYEREDGSLAEMDEARLQGNRITGRRTLRDERDITDLPQRVISQLASQWHPPEWIELSASVDDDGNTRLAGTRFRLHVTYDGYSHLVKRVHTSYAKAKQLNHNDRRKGP